MTELANESRVAIVTGGARGIGAAVCRHLAASGLRVAVTDIDGDAAAGLAAEIGPEHGGFQLDVSDERAVESTFDSVEARLGPVSVLVCSAGLLLLPGGKRPPVKDLEVELWERTFAVNLLGSFLCSREIVRRREKKPVAHGRVVFLSSIGGQTGGRLSSAAYAASKAAVLGYAKAFAYEAARLGITSNTIAPGLIDTRMLQSSFNSQSDLADAARLIPLQRIGTVEEVAQAIGFLVSPAASYITGSVIDVNGGARMQ